LGNKKFSRAVWPASPFGTMFGGRLHVKRKVGPCYFLPAGLPSLSREFDINWTKGEEGKRMVLGTNRAIEVIR
jgi:hypothetical protein